MPMHDWTKVDAGTYHMMHGAWLYAIADVLNTGLLPPAYYAMTERRVAGLEADVLTLRAGGPPAAPAAGGPAEPAVAVLERADKSARPADRRVVVRQADGHDAVAVIKLVSPGNT
ncbi:MAG TPA: DUF4058 domain-containing protein, partial [Urbifossiella sp.]|nr:DUF4058 domain-containing protein [Urbifossiella sp.]